MASKGSWIRRDASLCPQAMPWHVYQVTALPSSLLPGSEALLCFSPCAHSSSALEGFRHKSPCSLPWLPLISSPSDSCYPHHPEHLFLTSPSGCCSRRGAVLRDQSLCSLPLLSISIALRPNHSVQSLPCHPPELSWLSQPWLPALAYSVQDFLCCEVTRTLCSISWPTGPEFTIHCHSQGCGESSSPSFFPLLCKPGQK